MTQLALAPEPALGSLPPPVLAMPSKRSADPPPSRKAPKAEDASLTARFCAGHYAAIVRDYVDSPRPERAFEAEGPGSGPYVVGALAFVGRLEEARALFASQLRQRVLRPHDPDAVAARFFLGVAYCRAGRTEEAARELGANLTAPCRHGSAIARFYGVQGLACYRFFTGRLREAASHALAALEHAFSAGFAYGRLLATDLRGHALVQLGQVQAGLSLLATARTLGDALDLPGNVAVLDTARAIYRARFGVIPVLEAIAELDDLLDRVNPDDSYSRRSLQIELALQRSIAGAGDRAWAELERLTIGGVPDGGDARTRLRLLLACAQVAGLRYGMPAAEPYLAEARQIRGTESDVALTIDRLGLELLVTTDPHESERIVAELRSLERRSRATRSWLRNDASLPLGVLEEDRLGAIQFACRHGSPEVARLLVESKRLGFVPLALRLAPGRRLLLFGRTLLLEDHGNVSVAGDPSDGILRFLRALAERPHAAKNKEALLGEVWGIHNYRPDAHDPVVHTAVSRARALLGVRGHWIVAEDGGYRLADGVALLEVGAEVSLALPSAPPPALSAEPQRSTLFPPASAPEPSDPVLGLLSRGPLSSREVASHLGVSEMTALRRLRALCERGQAQRTGQGKNTRYHLEKSR